MGQGMGGPFDEYPLVGLGICFSFDDFLQLRLMFDLFLSASTRTANAGPWQDIPRFQFLDPLVNGVAVHARRTGKCSDPTETVCSRLAGGIMTSLFFVEFWQHVLPFLF